MQGGAKVPDVGPGWGWYSGAGKEGTRDTALWAKRQKEVLEVHGLPVHSETALRPTPILSWSRQSYLSPSAIWIVH